MSIVASRCSPILKFPSELRGSDNVALLLLRRCRFRSRVPQTLPLVSTRLCQPHLVLPAGADNHMTHGVFSAAIVQSKDQSAIIQSHQSVTSVSHSVNLSQNNAVNPVSMCCPTKASHAVWLSFCHSNCLPFDTHSMCCELTRSGYLVTQSTSLPYLNQAVARSSSHAVWLFRCHAICPSI